MLYVYVLGVMVAPFVCFIGSHILLGIWNFILFLTAMARERARLALTIGAFSAALLLGHAPLPGARTFPLRARNQDQVMLLQQWLEEGGGFVSGVTVASQGGLLATRGVEAGGVVAGVPLGMVMHDRTAALELPQLWKGLITTRESATLAKNDPRLLLILFLMEQRRQGSTSAWQRYGEILPQGRGNDTGLLSGFDNLPTFYNESVRGLLQGSAIGEEGAVQRQWMEHAWTVFCRSHTDVCRTFSFDEYAWASTVVGTRAFDLEVMLRTAKAKARGDTSEPKRVQARGTKKAGWTGLVRVPLIRVAVNAGLIFCDFADPSLACLLACAALSLPPSPQVPLIDMANHAIDPNCGYKFDLSRCDQVAADEVDHGHSCAVFQLVATRSIAAGEAVTVSYGLLNNYRSMVAYGFAQAQQDLGSFPFRLPDAPFKLALVQMAPGAVESERTHGRMRWDADASELVLEVTDNDEMEKFTATQGDVFHRMKTAGSYLSAVGPRSSKQDLENLDMMLYTLHHFSSDEGKTEGEKPASTLPPANPYLADAAVPLTCNDAFDFGITGGLRAGMALPVICLAGCIAAGGHGAKNRPLQVWGGAGRYSANSSVCHAAQHHTGCSGGTFLLKRHDAASSYENIAGTHAHGVEAGAVTIADRTDFSIERLGDKASGPRHSTASFAHFGPRPLQRANAVMRRLLGR